MSSVFTYRSLFLTHTHSTLFLCISKSLVLGDFLWVHPGVPPPEWARIERMTFICFIEGFQWSSQTRWMKFCYFVWSSHLLGLCNKRHLVAVFWFPGPTKTKCEGMLHPESVDREAVVAVFFEKGLDSLGSLSMSWSKRVTACSSLWEGGAQQMWPMLSTSPLFSVRERGWTAK